MIRYALICLLIGVVVINPTDAQVPSFSDLKNINVDQLTDEQIQALISRAKASGLSQTQLETLAIQKGISSLELSKLRNRISILKGEDETIDGTNPRQRNDTLISNAFKKGVEGETKIFGLNFFNSSDRYPYFSPLVNIPTPVNYVLGVGDEVIIDVYGASEKTYKKVISPDGQIIISGIGPIDLAGLDVQQAEKRLFNLLSTIYSGLKSSHQNTFMQVTLGKIRTITVNVIGEATIPGSYNVSSFSNIFNVVHNAGGPTENGSMRSIRLIRGSSKVAVFDLYKYLFEPDKAENPRLRDGDIIVIDSYLNRVSLSGAVKRPSKYEVLPNETLSDVLKYSGGLSEGAYHENILIIRPTEKMKSIVTVTKEKFEGAILKNGDSIIVGKVVDKFLNRVQVNGAVYRPGDYELTEDMYLSELIAKAEGLKENAFLERAHIKRLNENGTLASLAFNVSKVLDGSKDIRLQAEDKVFIQSIFDIRDKWKVSIKGEVRFPGTYDYAENMTIEDLILSSGGFTESANKTIVEIARQKYSSQDSVNDLLEALTIEIDENLKIPISAVSFELMPFDVVMVKRSPHFQSPKLVEIEGEVLHPGFYALKSRNEKVSDLLNRAGGLKNTANIDGASILRKTYSHKSVQANYDHMESMEYHSEFMKQIEQGLNPSLMGEIGNRGRIGIDLYEIMENPGGDFDFFLKDGDVLSIPEKKETVHVRGNVLNPNILKYKSKMTTRQSIMLAGGFTDAAKKGKTYIVYTNGQSSGTRSILGIRKYPKLKPGAEVIVPEKKPKNISVEKMLGITSALASIALLVDRLAN